MKLRTLISAVTALTLAACGSDDNSPKPTQVSNNHTPATQTELTMVAFAPDNQLSASIRWTDYGVPHIKADNLQSLAFGSGYAYAHDNICILADQIVKVRSERSKYFGPDKIVGSGDSKISFLILVIMRYKFCLKPKNFMMIYQKTHVP